MDNIAVHMRISGVAVSDDDVNSRRTAATSLAVNWRKETTPSKIVSKAADVAEALGGNGSPSPSLGSEIQVAIQKKSSSFLYEERPLEISVCAGMAMVSILAGSPGTDGWSTPDVYATALWSSLAYQPTLEAERRENLRQEVLDAARSWVATAAEKARERMNVPDPATVEITIDEDKEAANNFNEAVADTVEALRRNAALDREELDFLWWAQLGRSRLLNKQLSAVAEPIRIVAAGIEGARMLRRLPCEVHREIVLRTLDQDPKLDLAEMLAAVGDDRAALGAAFIEGHVADHPTVFPLLYALATGEVNGSGATVKRPVSEWGERALLEAGFAKMMAHGASKR
ncbi:GTPase-associated system all-helical protein GASH [Burkholderia stagnalis]|uniref:GTPase-associated system all-helical protein GASH n=1 Tax=Burkholderia stagnalis TaxID=1503054 RepID=UPI0009BFF2AB|nr:GTPase-associated system all-helical protein GASH [Burkholderia stagnalis]